MSQSISSYVLNSKSWIIRNVLFNFFKASNLYADIYREYHANVNVGFEKLKQLSDVLFLAKEEFHLIYKRLVDPRENKFEEAAKFTPDDTELHFIHNVGLLFHKAMVAREVKYMLEFYETEYEEDYVELKASLDDYIERLHSLFEKTQMLIRSFLANFKDDSLVLSFLFENDRYVEALLHISVRDLFQSIDPTHSTISLYLKVSQYFISSGWFDKAKRILYIALELEPDNKQVRNLLAAS